MSAEILKEFLVAVGFKADEDGARKVGEHIRTMTLGAVALGASLELLAATAFAATARISKTYSDIYYQSKKVGDSAGNIKAFSHAVSQLGGTAEEAGATLEEFSRRISAGGPGQEKWLEQFIGQTRDAKGALRETSEMVDSLLHSKKFTGSAEYLQRRYIEMAGIGENVWRASKDPNWQRHIEDAKKFNDAIGLDPQELAKKGKAFTEELRAIWMRIGAIRDKFLLNLGFEEPLKKFKKYLDEHSGDILKNLNAFVEVVKPFVIAFTNAAIQVGEFASAIANKLGPDTTAWVIIAGLGLKFTGMSTVITALATSVIPSLGGALGALMLGPSGVALRAIAGIAALGGLMSYFNMDTSPEAMKRGHKNENWTGHKSDGDGGSEETYGSSAERMRRGEAPPAKKKSLWERGKQWFNDKIGIAPAEGRETVEGQPGGETPTKGRSSRTKLTSEQRTEMATAIRKVAKERGLDPNDLAGIMSFETGGTMDPRKWGGDGGRYRGLIQWSPENRERYFAKYGGFEKATIAQQVEEAGRYLADRGVRRGDSLTSIYSAVLAGNANEAYWDRRDSNGTSPRSGAAAIRRSAHANALANLERATVADERATPTTPNVAPEVESQRPVHVPPVKLPDRLDAAPKYDYSKPGHPLIEPTTPKSSSPTTPQAPPHAVSPRPIGHTTTSNSIRHGDVSLNPKTTINVTTPGDAGAAARAIAGVQTRVNADAIRNMQGAAH